VLSLIGCASKTKTTKAADGNIPMEDFFRNPQVGQYQISPDGLYYAYLKPFNSRMNVHVRKVDGTGAETRITSQTDRDIASFFWKENSTIVFIRDFGGDENFHVFAVNVDGQGERDLTPFAGARAQIVSPLEQISDTDMIVEINKRDPKVFDAYRLNVKTGDLKMIAQNPGNYSSWMVDHAGQLRVATADDGANSSVFYRKDENQPFKEILKTNFKNTLSPEFFTFDNKAIYALSNLKRDKLALVIFDPETKKEVQQLYVHPDVDLSSVSYSKKRKVLVGARYVTWKAEFKFFDSYFEDIHKSLQAQLPGKEILITSTNRNEDKLIVRTYSDRSRGAFYLYDVANKKLTSLAEVSPWLEESKLSEMKPITYKTRDGLTIHGYLTLPPNSAGKNLPMVVNPHGGPWARDSWGFNPEVQFMASRGYAVFQMNFRGSTGYGKKFWTASFKKWGKEMQNDITDGVNDLIQKGTADKGRICIYGASYGGYAVLAGLAFTPDLYACGIDYVGVSNIFTLMETIPPYWEPFRQKLYEMVGHPVKEKALLTAASPLFHVDKIKAPLFVAQGAKDPRVKKSESDQIVEALKKRGIDVPYLVKENEGHGFHNEENRFEFYAQKEAFLRKHLMK